ncbi:MAG: AAA family ATPase [Prevotella sp.]|nr:AAA family ATPase [Prevotella sp.]
MKYPIGIQSFETIIEDGYVYIDKTALVYDLVHNGQVYLLCRPRRFGKSLLVSTLKCYFEGRKELFEGLAIDRLEKEWNRYPVLHLSFGGQNYAESTALDEVLEEFVATAEKRYGTDGMAKTLGSRFRAVLRQAHEKTGKKTVVLVDEYDKPLLDVMDLGIPTEKGPDTMSLEDYNRNVLKGFYSVFKEADADLQFVLLTGVTKFSQVSVFSGFNQPDDISMDERYEALCGITEEELYAAFDEPIKAMAARYKVAEDEMKYRLKRKFDGYHFSPNMLDIYNPFSILNAMSKKILSDYWFATGTPTYLVRLLSHCKDNMNELTGRYYPREAFVDYRADVEALLPMIYQSGYLTIKDWNMDMDSYLLDFPNDEVKRGFVTMLATSYLQIRESPTPVILQVVDAMKVGHCDTLATLLMSFFASIPYSQRRKDDEREKERYFQYTFYLVLRMISCFTVFVEKAQSEGRVDCVVETPKYVYIFEFKRDGSAEAALQQIEDRGYAKEYASDGRTIYQIGCNFSSETGTIDGWKVK